jgi:hypothetical protein
MCCDLNEAEAIMLSAISQSQKRQTLHESAHTRYVRVVRSTQTEKSRGGTQELGRKPQGVSVSWGQSSSCLFCFVCH